MHKGATFGIQLYNKFIISETAGLLPARYFEQRYKPDWDVRENLFEHQKSQKYSNHWSINAIEVGYQSDQPMGSLVHLGFYIPIDILIVPMH